VLVETLNPAQSINQSCFEKTEGMDRRTDRQDTTLNAAP